MLMYMLTTIKRTILNLSTLSLHKPPNKTLKGKSKNNIILFLQKTLNKI